MKSVQEKAYEILKDRAAKLLAHTTYHESRTMQSIYDRMKLSALEKPAMQNSLEASIHSLVEKTEKPYEPLNNERALRLSAYNKAVQEFTENPTLELYIRAVDARAGFH